MHKKTPTKNTIFQKQGKAYNTEIRTRKHDNTLRIIIQVFSKRFKLVRSSYVIHTDFATRKY